MVMFTHAQLNLTPEQWREDLRFLQKTVQNDYNFLFVKTTPDAFNASVEELYADIPRMQEHEIIIGFAKLVSSFKYGHTVLGFRYQPHMFHQLPFNLYQFKDGIYIQGTHKDYANTLGAKVKAIAGMPIDKALDKIYPVVPSENDQFFKAYFPSYLNVPEVLHAQRIIPKLTTSVELTLEKDGTTFTQLFESLPLGERFNTKYNLVGEHGDWLEARDQSVFPNYLKNLDKIYYYEYLDAEKAVYVRHSQIQHDPEEDTSTFYNRVFDFIENNDVEKLIIDVRLNGGGNNYFNRPVIKEIIRSEKINNVGNLFVIIGRRTFSACQNLVNEMSNYTDAIFVGEPTSENINFYGDNRRVELPNSKIPAFLSFAWWQDKAPWEGKEWLAPHIPVEMTFEEYSTNKDPVLQAALNYSEENYVLDPMGYFTDLFMKGEIEKLKSEAVRMVSNPNYQFFDFEGEFTRVGYNILGSNQIKEAIFVFQLLTELYPNSANAWSNLAEGFLKAGDKEKAKELYSKAVSLDNEGSISKKAKKILATIEE